MQTPPVKNQPEFPQLFIAKQLVYQVCGFAVTALAIEPESLEYAACALQINGLAVRFRAAKTTPKKVGQFVTLWRREKGQPIKPFDAADDVDLFVISVSKNGLLGQFVFPKAVLIQKDIVSQDGKGGKRAMRVYPAWDTPVSKQAIATQRWQLQYFFTMPTNAQLDCLRVKALYHNAKKI